MAAKELLPDLGLGPAAAECFLKRTGVRKGRLKGDETVDGESAAIGVRAADSFSWFVFDT